MEFRTNPITGISLLLVEDDKATLDCLALILIKTYPDVTFYTASDGSVGLELFKTHLPDIVITDFNMPEMHGRQMAKEIRAIKPLTKFIILSGDKAMTPLDDSEKSGITIDHYIEKPVAFKDLFGAIEQCYAEITQHGS